VPAPVPHPIPTLAEHLLREAEDPLVTLDQIAALVSRKKRSLEHYIRNAGFAMPLPEVQGGGGRASYWRWSVIRPWLISTFGRMLPERLRIR
jgi:hypothetical protein